MKIGDKVRLNTSGKNDYSYKTFYLECGYDLNHLHVLTGLNEANVKFLYSKKSYSTPVEGSFKRSYFDVVKQTILI